MQEIVPAGGGDFESAARHLLATNIGEIGAGGIGQGADGLGPAAICRPAR